MRLVVLEKEVLNRFLGPLSEFGVSRVQLGHGAVQHFVRQTFGQALKCFVHALAFGQKLFGLLQFGRSPLLGL